MQRAMAAAHQRMGLAPRMGYARMGSRDRWNPAVSEQDSESPSISTGYLPTIEYLNYLLPAAMLGGRLRRFPIIQLVSGVHSASLVPILARRPFVSWVATPFMDEIVSRRAGPDLSLSIRMNHALRAVNQQLERWTYRYPRFVFALSNYTARRLTDIARLSPERISVLRCPVDLDQFSRKARRGPGSPDGICCSSAASTTRERMSPRSFAPTPPSPRLFPISISCWSAGRKHRTTP